MKTVLCGKAFVPRLGERTKKVDSLRQANAIAPNVIHSLDAAAMMLTVSAMQRLGVTQFRMVHDSFATTAGHAPLLERTTRGAFVLLHHEPIVSMLHQQWSEATKAAKKPIPEPPPRGALDINSVIESEYFFN